ncbi:MAG: hypothetical protein MMC33_001085 [Icmadophila ericetorum]|nr:hypothetical protein [Icmadophila ericetorum]
MLAYQASSEGGYIRREVRSEIQALAPPFQIAEPPIIGGDRTVRFANLHPLSKDFEDQPMPDSWEANPAGTIEESIAEMLNGLIRPDSSVPLLLPNFFIDVADAETDVQARCCHAAAFGARGSQKLRWFRSKGQSDQQNAQDLLDDREAYTLSVVYYPDEDAAMEIYATHMEQSRVDDL